VSIDEYEAGTDLPTVEELTDALTAASAAHHDYESETLRGVRDEHWAGFYAAFVLGRLGPFTTASRLAELLADVDAPSDWSAAAAHCVVTLEGERTA
jgi:hypothetical protein